MTLSLKVVYFVQFVYINSAFAPALDDTVANLYKVKQRSSVTSTDSEAAIDPDLPQSFGTENHLLVNYSSTQAWG